MTGGTASPGRLGSSGGTSRPGSAGSPKDGNTGEYDGFSGPDARLRAQAQAARLLYPELRDLSDRDAVAVAMGGGGTLGAYADYRAREAVRLRRENDLLRQNQETLRRAPVRGVSSGAPQTRGRDPFEVGFDEDGW
ncbi:MAG: hypothetical protein IJT94_00530 [Oscillibacter sp.]|nr:hypothetical protein [Oscillibacter sp.]